MKVARRRQAMLDAVIDGVTDVEALCARFGVSEATVRRDLNAMAHDGLILRTYGGAAAPTTWHEPEPTLEQRKHCQSEIKQALARKAVTLIDDGDSLLLDGGTTTAALADCLSERKRLHIITNNMAALPALTTLEDGEVTVLGGKLRASGMTTHGRQAHRGLADLSVDHVFMSADGLEPTLGLCEASDEQAWLKEAMMARAANIVVLADATKLGHAGQQHWAAFPKSWTLITDATDTTLLDGYRRVGATVITL